MELLIFRLQKGLNYPAAYSNISYAYTPDTTFRKAHTVTNPNEFASMAYELTTTPYLRCFRVSQDHQDHSGLTDRQDQEVDPATKGTR